MKKNKIQQIEENSIAWEVGIQPGDYLISINDTEVKDIFDYRYLIQEDYIEVLIEDKNGEQTIFEIEKYEEEDLGLVFEEGLLDDAKSCTNKCIFCFIDQLPPNMRPTLYFKDDDSRLSFLQGNYITLTNMKERDLEHILFYHLSPINISVHTTDEELRYFMLKNPHSRNLLPMIEKLDDANIQMNFQIVLCKGVNDGDHLNKTIEDLGQYIGNGKSLSIVPVGLTKYRDELFLLESFDKDDCLMVISQIEQYQEQFLERYGTRFVYASDEFYIKAEVPLPDAACYEDFPQLENGVGMISLLKQKFQDVLGAMTKKEIHQTISVVTGQLAFPFIQSMADQLMDFFPGLVIMVYPVYNEFFGDQITVSGLLTGTDIVSTLKNKELGALVLLPKNCLRAEETVLLDDVTIQDLEEQLGIPIKAVPTTGKDFIDTICSLIP